MFNKIKTKFKNNTEIVALGLLIMITIISTSYYNHVKKKIYSNYKSTINNVYLKKTINHIFNNLEPKFKSISHNILPGETFDNILSQYSISKDEIEKIKKEISKKVNINKLNTDQKIKINIDQSNNLIKEFVFQLSNTEKIYLNREVGSGKFSQKILVTKLNKKVVYKENIILSSLYKSASQKKIPANIIVEFARIYGFQVDFQRDIRKKDSFQIMYEVFIDDNKRIIESGNILFANLKLNLQTKYFLFQLYFFFHRQKPHT